MKYKSTSLSHQSVLSFATLVVFSIACQSSSSNSNVPQSGNTEKPAAASNSPLAAANLSTPDRPEVKSSTKPGIQITEVPSKGAGPDAVENIAGTVSGVNARECKVVVFARTNTWYVQPYIDSSDTSINEDGTWKTDTHLGSQYAALLVKNSYKPPTTTGKLPLVGGAVLAIAIADAKH
jgi:hypothetical protein